MNTIEEVYERAYDQAIRLLARRAHSTWELQYKLRRGKNKISAAVMQRVCERCQELGYLNDADFAMSRARYRLLHARHGPRRIQAELRALHIDELYIQQALDALLAETDEVKLATVALSKHFGDGSDGDTTLSRAQERKEKKRRYDFLLRRGFSEEAIWQILA